jgi:hypothetical protein
LPLQQKFCETNLGVEMQTGYRDQCAIACLAKVKRSSRAGALADSLLSRSVRGRSRRRRCVGGWFLLLAANNRRKDCEKRQNNELFHSVVVSLFSVRTGLPAPAGSRREFPYLRARFSSSNPAPEIITLGG